MCSQSKAPLLDCPASPHTKTQTQTKPVLDVDSVKEHLQGAVNEAIAFCQDDNDANQNFFAFEKSLLPFVVAIGRLLIQLYLVHRHKRLDVTPYLDDGTYRVLDANAERTLKTAYGKVTYERAYLAPRAKGVGFHPLDMILGLTRDTLTPYVIQFVTNLATRMSFGAARVVCRMALNWTPAQETIEECVLGMGRQAAAFVKQQPAPAGDGDVLLIEIDCKCVPTATNEELKKRSKRCKGRKCKRKCKCCQRHRGKAKRKARGSRKRRKKGDKSKNGKQAMLVVMYTLKRGEDGKLHGPINKKEWGTFAGRTVALEWAKAEAAKRGFDPASGKTIQIVMDGDKNFRRLTQEYFPQAQLTLDIYHVIERLWELARHYHAEGSEKLKELVESWKEDLYAGRAAKLVEHFKELLRQAPKNGPGTKGRRKNLAKQIGYMEPRLSMMNYGELRRQDMVIGSGQVEGGVRHVIGQRMDSAAMRWKREKAEALLQLRCIMINGDWEAFATWHAEQCRQELQHRGKVKILTEEGIKLPPADKPAKSKGKSNKTDPKRKAA
jgi:hypothetical protein